MLAAFRLQVLQLRNFHGLSALSQKIGRKLHESVCRMISYLGICAVVAQMKSQLIAVMRRVLDIGQPKPGSTIMKFCK
jgi:hypothetical protein